MFVTVKVPFAGTPCFILPKSIVSVTNLATSATFFCAKIDVVKSKATKGNKIFLILIDFFVCKNYYFIDYQDFNYQGFNYQGFSGLYFPEQMK